jgi:quinol-cytochrome oxidoreductase complex cytochrome b subunit
MTPDYASPSPFGLSSVNWGAVIAGGIVAAAISLFLFAFGSGVGFLVVSPWADRGISASTFAWSAAIYLIVVSMISSTVGGYLAGRLRRRWSVDPDEVYFRDSAHGVLTWAFAVVLGASVLASATTNLLGGAASGVVQSAPGDRQGVDGASPSR